MRAYVIVAAIACCLVLSASAFVPRHRRDVSELAAATSNDAVEQPAYEYLPPEPKLAPALEPEVAEIETTAAPTTTTSTLAPEPSVRVGDNGYEYRTVRRLKYRTRRLRDVSHLATHYLPPAAQPQREYLPPVAAAQETAPAPAPVDDTEEVIAAAPAPKVANDYLPPVQETPVVTEPIDVETEAPAPVEPEVVEAAPEEVVEEEEQPQDTAVLAEDGYHYKQPAQPFELKQAPSAPAPTPAAPAVTAAPAAPEYLPPLSDDAVAVEGPEESAVLAADGYHYRAIRRLRF